MHDRWHHYLPYDVLIPLAGCLTMANQASTTQNDLSILIGLS
jgi:hypothetical protein